jgi:Ca2+/H+ antiporter
MSRTTQKILISRILQISMAVPFIFLLAYILLSSAQTASTPTFVAACLFTILLVMLILKAVYRSRVFNTSGR